MVERVRYSSGTPWEEKAGYSRAVRVGNVIYVAGTAPAGPDGKTVAPGDAYGQARYVLQKIGWALREVGACLDDVVRVRMYATDIGAWDGISRAHREAFAVALPASTLVVVKGLMNKDMLVEIEVEAVVDELAPAG